jgi:DNA-binding response OmpR family regulator
MGQKRRILIIDDNKEIVLGLKAFFERKYEILTAHDGFEGLQAFEKNENNIDLVITDLVMPELSGVGMISILKKKYPGIPIIAITGWRGNIEATGNRLYADQIFEKPFDISDLDKSVSNLLTNIEPTSYPGKSGH